MRFAPITSGGEQNCLLPLSGLSQSGPLCKVARHYLQNLLTAKIWSTKSYS